MPIQYDLLCFESISDPKLTGKGRFHQTWRRLTSYKQKIKQITLSLVVFISSWKNSDHFLHKHARRSLHHKSGLIKSPKAIIIELNRCASALSGTRLRMKMLCEENVCVRKVLVQYLISVKNKHQIRHHITFAHGCVMPLRPFSMLCTKLSL